MGKSKETWNKKETEKKKQKKKKDKEQKKQERKAHSQEETSFDDMIAYVDEFGNLTDTPPDPANKKKVKKEDIEVSVPKQEAMKQEDVIRKGTVKFFNDSKGYGFIKDDQNQDSIFVHVNGLIDEIQENDKVTFEITMGQRGPNAINVKLVN
jgi:cold shock CspA family protein